MTTNHTLPHFALEQRGPGVAVSYPNTPTKPLSTQQETNDPLMARVKLAVNELERDVNEYILQKARELLPRKDAGRQSDSLNIWLPEEYKDADLNRRQGTLTAYMTVYNHPDTGLPYVDPYDDVIVPGAFTKTIQQLNAERKSRNNPWLCPDLWQHDRKEVIGGVKALTEDSKGVIYETQFSMKLRRAQEAFELAEARMLGSSYGYDAVRSEPRNGIRYLLENRLREVSQVTFPANSYAPIIGTKSDEEEQIDITPALREIKRKFLNVT